MIQERTTVYIQEVTKQLLRQRPVVVYLQNLPDGLIHDYFCSTCRASVIKFKGDVLLETPGELKDLSNIIVHGFPFSKICPNKDCRRFYTFIGIVSV